MILSHDTGQLREVQPQLNIYSGGPGVRWSPDGRSLAIQARDAKGRRGLFRIDATTGEAVPIALSGEEGRFSGPVWSADGKRLYYSRVHDEFTILVERDLASGDEKEIIRRSGRTAWLPDLSPDGQYWAAPDGDWVVGPPVVPGRTRAWTVVLIPAGGGAPKELMRMESQGGGVLFWAPDSLALFVYSIKDKSTGEREVWRVPIDGTLPQRLDLNVNFLGPFGNSDQQFHAHPDGKRVAFAATERTRPEEVWVLENFLPTAAMKAGRR
jgi:Tol biopolymer transport system component